MGKGPQSDITGIQEHASALDRELAQLAEKLKTASSEDGRTVLMGVFHALTRLADASQPVAAACPTCKGTGGVGEFEAVNELSGVWNRPECPTCRELAKLIRAIGDVSRKVEASDRA
jgi:hypothetical protein